MLEFLLWVCGIFLVLYWLSMVLRSDAFWNWVLGIDEPWRPEEPERPLPPRTYPKPIGYSTYWPEKWIYKAPVVKPRVQKDFGSHINPLSLEASNSCDGQFEQMDARTWQCLKCSLLQFMESEPKGESKP
jgi:hypothetical protein